MSFSGKVFFCPFIRVEVGDLTQSSLEEVWNGERYVDMRKRLLEHGIFPVCRRCCKVELSPVPSRGHRGHPAPPRHSRDGRARRDVGQKTLLVNPPLVGGVAFTRQGRCQEREEVLGTTKPPYTLALLAAMLRDAGCDVRLVDLTAERRLGRRPDRPPRSRGLQADADPVPEHDADARRRTSRDARQAEDSTSARRSSASGRTRRRRRRRRWSARRKSTACSSASRKTPRSRWPGSTRWIELSTIPSLTWRRTATVVPHTAHGTYSGFATMPYPAWDLVPSDLYSLPLVNRPYVIVETSRGCPYSCDFCVAPIHQGHKFRERSAKALVDEIEKSYRDFGIDFFYLWGDTVTLNVKTFTAFCDELIARNLPIQWFGNARADNLTDPAFVHRLRKAGCWMLAMGIETESEEIRKDMVKRLERVEDPDRARTTCATPASGRSPSSSSATRARRSRPSSTTIEYAIELNPDFANFYPAVPYPGTALYDKVVRDGMLVGRRLVADGVLVLPAQGQRPRRARGDGRDQPRQAPVLHAPVVYRPAGWGTC